MSIVFSCDLRQGCFVSGCSWAEIKCVHPGKFLCLSRLHKLTDRVALYRSFRKYLITHIFIMFTINRANLLTVRSPVLNMRCDGWWCASFYPCLHIYLILITRNTLLCRRMFSVLTSPSLFELLCRQIKRRGTLPLTVMFCCCLLPV